MNKSKYQKYSQMNYHILCSDDNEEIGEAYVGVFHEFTKCKIAHLMNVNDTFEYLEANNVDLVITDQMKPGMSGLEMTNIITKKYPTKVIVATGYGGTHREAFSKGASAYAIKPFNLCALLEIVYKVMKESATNLLLKGGKNWKIYKISQTDLSTF